MCSLKRYWDCDFNFVNVLELHQSMINDINERVLIWRFTLVLIKINYGQIGDQTGLFHTTNPIFYTSGNRFVRRTGTFGNLCFFSLVPSDNRNTGSTCPTSVFTGIGQTLMSRPDIWCLQVTTISKKRNLLTKFSLKINRLNQLRMKLACLMQHRRRYKTKCWWRFGF